jgi:hypothetical protein
MINSFHSPSAVSTTMRPPLENRVGRRDKLIALSRERFARRREKIEAKLRRWMGHESSEN